MNHTLPIPHSRPFLGEEEWHAVAQVLESHQLAQGPQVKAFEETLSVHLKRHGGVAVSSGTAALYLGLQGLGIKPGDEVLMPSYVCAAPWIAVTKLGAHPILVDIDPATFSIDPDKAKACITTRTRAIIVPHLFGLPADLEHLQRLGVPIIEDCAQTLLATQHGQSVGSVGEVAICSFFANKLLCAGEGGMVLSNDPQFLDTIRSFREFDEETSLNEHAFNFKMTDIQAAIGLCQVARLEDNIQRRRALAQVYYAGLAHLPIGLPIIPQHRTHIFYRFVITVSQPVDELVARLHRQDIHCRRPVFQALHRYLGLPGFPGTDQTLDTALSLPIHPSLEEEDIHHIITVLHEELS